MRVQSVFASLLLLLAIGCQCAEYEALPLDPTIVFQGDSILHAHAKDCSSVSAQLGMEMGVRVPDDSTDGAFMSGGVVREIPAGYETALANLPDLQVVVTNGGLNDLTYECAEEDLPECAVVTDQIAREVQGLLQRMLDDGMSAVVYVGMYELKADYARYDTARASLMDAIASWCGPNGVTYVDTEPVFVLHPEYYQDGRHPTTEGAGAIASLVRQALQTAR